MAASQLSHSRQRAESLSHQTREFPTNPPTPSLPPSRESSVLRGRALTTTTPGQSNPSPRSRTPAVGIPKLTTGHEGTTLERRPSGSYGHHRQASIVHGNMQHSRNTSFSSPTTSPVTPQMIADAVGPHTMDSLMMAEKDVGNLSLPNGSSGSASKGHSPSASATLPGGGSDSLHAGTRRMDRNQLNGRSRREHTHTRSQSRHHPHPQESRTVGEYALHHLFNAFIALADQKINQCLSEPLGVEPRIESLCGPGVDFALDQLISALGHISRQKPKPLIDTLMVWRMRKNDAANAARQELHQARNLASTTSLPTSSAMDASATLQQKYEQADRRSTVSVYLLCRVLMEIMAQSTLADVTPAMAERLEDLFYKQISIAQPEQLDESPFLQSNWVIFGELLGEMSGMHFDRVSGKFLSDLDHMQLHTGRKEYEGRAVLVIRGMRCLRIRYQPEDAWDRSCEFLTELARISSTASGQPVKYAFNTLWKELFLPIAGGATSELNSPKWAAVTESIKPRLQQMLTKPKHWQNAFPTLTAVLCVSPHESFSSQWLTLVMPLQSKLKERSTRPDALRGICRLVWTYIFRTSDPHNIAVKNLTEIVKLVFIPGRRSYMSTDPEVAEPIIQLIRIMGYKYHELCFKSIIFPLMNVDLFTAGRELKIIDLEPEKIVIGIRAFLAIIADLEKGQSPPFPVTFDTHPMEEPFITLLSPRPPIDSFTKTTLSKEDRLSKPVMSSGFDEITMEAYGRFCRILGDITLFCDNTFGGQAVLDEKFSQTPKTPISEAFSFGRRDDHQNQADARQGFYDLLHVAVQALPRCLSTHISFKSLVNLLCTGTAHVQRNIAASSVQSLKSIAKQGHAQPVTVGFARFIFNFDDRYATMSDGGMLGPDHIESTLKLYVELLQIWIEEITQKTKRVAAESPGETVLVHRGAHLDHSGLWAQVDEVESHGLFFLCSPSRRVRAFAATVLRLVTEFDTALGKDSTRIIRIMEGSPELVINVNDEKLSVAERSRLQKTLLKNGPQSPLVELCKSDAPYDSGLWFKIFPNLVRNSSELCPVASTLTREIVCARISQMQRTITSLADPYRNGPYSSTLDLTATKGGARLANTAPDIVIEQWRLYLVFACTTLTMTGPPQQPLQGVSHTRKGSKPLQSSEKIFSAGELFGRIIPFLAVTNRAVRDAVVTGLGSINKNLYRTLLEALHPAVKNCNDEAKIRMASHQRTVSSPRRPRRTDHLRTEIAHIHRLTSHFLQSPDVFEDEWILNNLVNYTQELRLFLNDAEIQNEWDFYRLRAHYCGLMEELYEGIKKSKEPSRWMSFQARKAAFALMEDWCGYSPNQSHIRQREDEMKRTLLNQEQEHGGPGITSAAIEIEKRDLRTAALSAMAALCGGPVSVPADNKAHLQFDVVRMFQWIDAILDAPSDKTRTLGRRALKNLIIHNKEYDFFLGRAIEMCYLAKSPKALESYFEVTTQVLTEREDFAPEFWKILGAGLYTLGNENNQLRIQSARLLRTLEERMHKSSKLQDLDISISDKTIAVYKRAQFEMSQRLAKQHSELAFHVFSEFSKFFKQLQPDHQRNIVAAMLPWIQAIELQLDPNGGPTATSYMLLVNLFEITVKFGNALHNEIQALWQALASGPHGGNVQLVLDFMISLCLEKREQSFVDYARQIVVYLAGTPAGSKVVEFFLLQITPKAMVHDKDKRHSFIIPHDARDLPYLADLNTIFPGGPAGSKQQGLSLGQLSVILLVDLMVAPTELSQEFVPLLLQVVLVLWDHYIPLVQDQAREMLVHLIHELVISKIDNPNISPTQRSIEDFIEMIRRRASKVDWIYEDFNGKKECENDLRVPESMVYVSTQVVKIFSISYPSIREELGKTALKWASNCPVHHLACRSFQVFRSILSSLDQPMLADMLARLSNTIADDGSEVQTFSMEILTTLKTVVDAFLPEDLAQYPQLFWTTCACLDTIHEREFIESLSMLEKILDKIDLSDPETVQRLTDNKPKWDGQFDGLMSLVYKGVRSSICLDKTLQILEKLAILPPNELIGDETGLVFTILANIPRFLRWYEHDAKEPTVPAAASTLAQVAEAQGQSDLSSALLSMINRLYRSDMEFLSHILSSIRMAFFPDLEFNCLVFLLSLLTNKLPWFKVKTMQLLCKLIPEIDMRKPEIASKGPDLISPLLRLLQTEFCPQALAVLDNVMTMNATPLDNKHLRMSMVSANSSRATRKEYERTQSLYGIPEESGWSIPMPAIHSSTTRRNVHSVFYTCAAPGIMEATEDETPNIKLVEEEYNGSYFPDYRTATMMSDDTRGGDGHVGDLNMKLEALDDFFDDDTSEFPPPAAPSNPLSRLGGSSVDVRENLYEQQTFPILHKSLTRNASVSSFQNGFSDLRVSPSREAMIMTPGAFTVNRMGGAPALKPSRPTMHARSATSPAANQNSPPGTAISTDETTGDDFAFSDDDISTGRPSGGEKLPKQGLRSGFRSGIRRLTGGGGDAKDNARAREAIRAQLNKSPEVPKVPDMYLINPKTSDF